MESTPPIAHPKKFYSTVSGNYRKLSISCTLSGKAYEADLGECGASEAREERLRVHEAALAVDRRHNEEAESEAPRGARTRAMVVRAPVPVSHTAAARRHRRRRGHRRRHRRRLRRASAGRRRPVGSARARHEPRLVPVARIRAGSGVRCPSRSRTSDLRRLCNVASSRRDVLQEARVVLGARVRAHPHARRARVHRASRDLRDRSFELRSTILTFDCSITSSSTFLCICMS